MIIMSIVPFCYKSVLKHNTQNHNVHFDEIYCKLMEFYNHKNCDYYTHYISMLEVIRSTDPMHVFRCTMHGCFG